MKKEIFCAILAIVLLLNISVVFATETNEVEEDLILTMNDSIEDLTNVPLVSDTSQGQGQFFDENQFLSEENVNFKDAIINGNLIITGKNVNLQNISVNGDVVIFAQTIEISNFDVTNGVTIIAGQDLNLNMLSSSGNIYTVGQNINANVISNGLYLAAADVKLGNESQISKLYNYSGNLSLDGGSYGKVEANIENLHIGSNTIISDNLKYSSSSEGNIDASAQIGNIEYKKVENEVEPEETKADILKERTNNIFSFVIKIAIICGFIFLFTDGFNKKIKTMNKNTIKYITVSAFKVIVVYLLITIILFVFPFLKLLQENSWSSMIYELCVVGIIFLVFYVINKIILFVGVSIISVVIMNNITKNMLENKWKKYGITLLIALVIGILREIPIFGKIITFFVGFAGMGIFFNSLKPNKTKNDEITVDIVKEKVEEVNENENEK